MDSQIAREMISVIRTERQRLAHQLTVLDQEDHDSAWEQWQFQAEPFVNDMCLMVLVALRHQVERELVFLAARANVGETISGKQYEQNIVAQRQALRERNGWRNLIASLDLNSFPEWNTSMKVLELLANCLKHDPKQEPDEGLLAHLNLPLKPVGRHIVGYAQLPESRCFREGLARYVSLPNDADYCTIADTFVDLANLFLEKVRGQTKLAQLSGAVSLVEFAC
jgi:hypothetical protein